MRAGAVNKISNEDAARLMLHWLNRALSDTLASYRYRGPGDYPFKASQERRKVREETKRRKRAKAHE